MPHRFSSCEYFTPQSPRIPSRRKKIASSGKRGNNVENSSIHLYFGIR